jgi:hypothetical protein
MSCRFTPTAPSCSRERPKYSANCSRNSPNACPNGDWPSFLRNCIPLALPALRRGHDRGSEIYGCGIIHMRLLRFFVACPPRAALGCAPALRRTRVPIPPRHITAPRSAHASALTWDTLNDRHATVPVHPCSPSSRFGNRLPFKSHSAPRPPQTPAASS